MMQPTLRPVSGGELLRRVGAITPRTHPRSSLTILLWVLGLYAAFYAQAPVTVTPKAQAAYMQRMAVADQLLPRLTEAAHALGAAQADAYRAREWFWRFKGPAVGQRVAAADARVRVARVALRGVEKEHRAKLREARRELGLWSDAGVDAARASFWKQYQEGKRFATRSTFYDVLWAVINGTTRTEEPVINFVMHWLMVTCVNFTTGMLSAVLAFCIGLPSLIWSFGASFWSGLLFFAVASVSATAVSASFLGAVYGAAGGAAYATVRIAAQQARLQEGRAERQGQLPPRRQHAD